MVRTRLFVWFCALFVVHTMILVACGGGGDGDVTLDADAGPLDAEGQENPENRPDGGTDDVDYCQLVVARTCGPSETECREAPSCEAALLLERYEPERCEDALANPETYAPCTDDACTKLVEKTCGAAPEPLEGCADTPGCTLARDLYSEARDETASAEDRQDAREACAAGLEDGVVFAACTAG